MFRVVDIQRTTTLGTASRRASFIWLGMDTEFLYGYLMHVRRTDLLYVPWILDLRSGDTTCETCLLFPPRELYT